MHFKKRTVVLFVAIICQFSFASIGENFQKAGLEILGHGNLYWPNFNASNFSASVAGGLEFFLIDNFSAYFSVGYGLTNYGTPVHDISGDLGAAYYFVPNPQNSVGPVHELSLGISNVFTFDESSNAYSLYLTPRYSFLYFLTDHIAPEVSVSPSFLLSNGKDAFGSLSVYFGFRFFLPNKDKVLIPLK